jgi:hypothetical protein
MDLQLYSGNGAPTGDGAPAQPAPASTTGS